MYLNLEMVDNFNPNVFRVHKPDEAIRTFISESITLAEVLQERDIEADDPVSLTDFILDHKFKHVPSLNVQGAKPIAHSSGGYGKAKWRLSVPFDGDGWWWSAHPPNMSHDNIPDARYEGGEHVEVQILTEVNVGPDKLIDVELRKLDLGLSILKGLVKLHKDQVRPQVLEIIRKRKSDLEARNKIQSCSKYAVNLRRDVPEAVNAPVVRKRLTPAVKPATVGIESDPILAQEIFVHVIGLIESMGRVFELSPSKAFKNMTEEDFRFVLLLALNSHYEGQATAETFTLLGRSDIRIVWKGASVFIAECKIWKGPENFSKALQQLEGYKTWRDTKAALILFNRDGQLSTILRGVDNVIRCRANFLSAVSAQTTTSPRYLMRHPGDPDKAYDLVVIVLDVPRLVSRSAPKVGKSSAK